jgi:hypothetical protein
MAWIGGRFGSHQRSRTIPGHLSIDGHSGYLDGLSGLRIGSGKLVYFRRLRDIAVGQGTMPKYVYLVGYSRRQLATRQRTSGAQKEGLHRSQALAKWLGLIEGPCLIRFAAARRGVVTQIHIDLESSSTPTSRIRNACPRQNLAYLSRLSVTKGTCLMISSDSWDGWSRGRCRDMWVEVVISDETSAIADMPSWGRSIQ